MSRASSPLKTASPSLFTALSVDTRDRTDGPVAVEGTLPPGLDGVLFRNGPGLFRRNGQTKRSLLDGDGVVQRLELRGGQARYARRFVRTPKLEAEAQASRFLLPTWTTAAPGLFANVGARVKSQAGVTVYRVGAELFALDEVRPGFVLDPQTLETRGPISLGLPEEDQGMKAHARQLAGSGDWVFASTRLGARGMQVDLVRRRADGSTVATPTVQAPRMTYVHDFGVTERFAVLVLHAVHFNGLRFMSGLASFTESLAWRPALGNVVLLVDLATGSTQTFEAPASWCWHIANAYEHGQDVVVDFVGYDDPGHFLGPDAQLTALMRGEEGVRGAPGHLRRYVLQRASGTLSETRLSEGNHEFPSIDSRECGTAHGRIYVTSGQEAGILHSGLTALEPHGGRRDHFDFGAHVVVGEPVFAPDPTRGAGEGWLLTQTLDLHRQETAFAVLDGARLAEGPVATVRLGEPVPISFHGQWVA